MAFGAMPPPGAEWQVGRTAASIRFVRDAESYIARCRDDASIVKLRQAIENTKRGELVLSAWLMPEQYLARS